MPSARQIENFEQQSVPPEAGAKAQLPLAFRPLHQMWRRTIDTIHVSEISLPVRGLPVALSGVTACQISDFHVDRDEDLERLELAVETINRERPDLIFLTGDYFSGHDTMRRYIDPFRDAISKLRPGAGLFAILGNHDHWASAERVADALRKASAEVLANDSRKLALRGEQLTIIGIDDLWARRAEPARAFAGVAAEDCTIVLAHNPDTALYARHLRPGVMLSGHTHGGVVRIPFYGSPLKSILRIGKRFYSGLNRYEDFYIYTNRGLGTMWVRIRINCPPEVSRFTLAPLADSAIGENPATAIRPRSMKRVRRRSTPRRATSRSKRTRN
ncbi:MAG TPA: metallophosphoesterase [Candidatus Binataceae bacterium]|nr:metallophosphoesterase [Candidatus Binataceae bacterium]